jgi:hypothetical protein
MNSSAAEKRPGYVWGLGEVFSRRNPGFVFRFDVAPVSFPVSRNLYLRTEILSLFVAHLIQTCESPYVSIRQEKTSCSCD